MAVAWGAVRGLEREHARAEGAYVCDRGLGVDAECPSMACARTVGQVDAMYGSWGGAWGAREGGFCVETATRRRCVRWMYVYIARIAMDDDG